MALLDGIRVVDLSRFVSGPFCSMTLGDLGADVIKVEQPKVGDNTRKWAKGTAGPDNPYFMSVNRSKRSIVLDLKNQKGMDVLAGLVKVSDVVLHNLRPGSLESLGASFEWFQKINPRIILCEISGYGVAGPDAERAAFDMTIQAESGLMSLNGEPDGPPAKIGAPLTDVMTSMMSCIAINAALVRRERTGKGAHITTSMLETTLACMPNVVSEYLVDDVFPARWGNGHPNIVPYGIFKASDGWVTIGIAAETHWAPFCKLIGRADFTTDPRFSTNPQRLVHREEFLKEFEPIIAAHPRSYWRDKMAELGLPSAPINSVADTLDGPQAAALGVVQNVEHPTRGTIRMVRSPIRVDDEYFPIKKAPPTLGQHTDEILKSLLGLSASDVASLRTCGAVE